MIRIEGLPDLIKGYREKNGITQEKLASMIGVPTITLRNWEYGGVTPNPLHANFEKLTSFLEKEGLINANNE